jgi:hypothetical protein
LAKFGRFKNSVKRLQNAIDNKVLLQILLTSNLIDIHCFVFENFSQSEKRYQNYWSTRQKQRIPQCQ